MEDDSEGAVHRPPWVTRWTKTFDLPVDWADPVLAQYSEFVTDLSGLVYPDVFIGSDISEMEANLDRFAKALDDGDVDFITCSRFFLTYHETLQTYLPSSEDDIAALYERLQRNNSPTVHNVSREEFSDFCQGSSQQRELHEFVDRIEKTFCYVCDDPPQPGDTWLVSPPEMTEFVLTVEVLREVEPTAPAIFDSIADPAQLVEVRGVDSPETTAHGPTPAVGDKLTVQPLSFNFGSKLDERT